MKRVAVYCGSFNPIHIGHTVLANYICEYCDIDEVWFSVSPENPLKETVGMASDEHRMEMVRLALEGYPRFLLCDIEMHLPRPSYTIHTLEALKKQYPELSFVLMIGADNWDIFSLWKEPERIIQEFGLIIYPRKGCGETLKGVDRPNVTLIDAPEIEISSTYIREAFVQGKNPRFFLSEKVYEYIRKHQIYK